MFSIKSCLTSFFQREGSLNILITGCSSGLGYELAKKHIENGDNVFGISRSLVNLSLSDFLQVDFKLDSAYNKIRQTKFLMYVPFDRFYMNAGELGAVKSINETTRHEILDIINSSVLGSKEVLDMLLTRSLVKKVILTSSGAALKTYPGFSLYCLVKSMNLKLIQSYISEFPGVEFVFPNPGPFESKMQKEIRSYDENLFPPLVRFHEIKDKIPTATKVAEDWINDLY